MTTSDKVLVILLRFVGVGALFALVAVFMPSLWMAAIHRWLGLGEMPSGPVMEYLARSLSAFYALAGAVCLVLASDLERYRPLVRFLGAAFALMGLVALGVDLAASMPWWWTASEGPGGVVVGALMFFLGRKEDWPRMSWREVLLTKLGTGVFGGITLGCWLRMLRDNDFAVDPPYWGRAAAITMNSIPNTLLAAWENLLYRQRISVTRIEPPLFVLGIWRSGTTHLHNLLAQDDRFAYPNTYQVSFPQTLLTTERINARLVGFFVPRKRLMDNVAFGVAEPQEDEFALAVLIGGFSLAWAFPRREEFYNRYLTLRDTSPEELAEWKAALTWFLQKLTLKYGKPLVLKSPGHTCRIKVLLEMFPEAKFVHIRRNPFDVFRSTEHLMRTGVTPLWTLQRPDFRDLDDRIIRQFKEVYDAFFEERGLIPQGHFHEISFEELDADPIRQVRRIYEALGLADFAAVEPALTKYVESLAGYKKNAHPELPAELRARIAREWRRCFEEWGYSSADRTERVGVE